jgi:hypothetical protein
MLPQGLVADLAGSADHRIFRSLHPKTQTVARLLAGRCSCDLVRQRLTDTQEDERHLRERYRRLGIPRSAVIAALERHRRASELHAERVDWLVQLAAFVGEHARNAGPTLYYLQFSSVEAAAELPRDIWNIGAASVRSTPEKWLKEGTPTLVTR